MLPACRPILPKLSAPHESLSGPVLRHDRPPKPLKHEQQYPIQLSPEFIKVIFVKKKIIKRQTGSCIKSMSRLAVGWIDTSTKPTCPYIATAWNYAIMSDKFKSDNMYWTSSSQKYNKDNNKQHDYKRRQCNCYSNVQCLNKEIHFGL